MSLLREEKLAEEQLSLVYDVKYEFGVSTWACDGDNCIKIFQDALCEKLGLNDNRICHWDVTKVVVPKGEEYIKYVIKQYEEERM